jgi:hypothetical protein
MLARDELDEEELEARSSAIWEEDQRVRAIELSYLAAHDAIELARMYRSESRSTGRRERECLLEVARLRQAIAVLRGGVRSVAPASVPGVVKAAGAVRVSTDLASNRRSA